MPLRVTSVGKRSPPGAYLREPSCLATKSSPAVPATARAPTVTLPRTMREPAKNYGGSTLQRVRTIQSAMRPGEEHPRPDAPPQRGVLADPTTPFARPCIG